MGHNFSQISSSLDFHQRSLPHSPAVASSFTNDSILARLSRGGMALWSACLLVLAGLLSLHLAGGESAFGGSPFPLGWVATSIFNVADCSVRAVVESVQQLGMCTTSFINGTASVGTMEITTVVGTNLETKYYADPHCLVADPFFQTAVSPISDGKCHPLPSLSKPKAPWSFINVVTKSEQPPLPEFTSIVSTGFQTADSCKKSFPVTGLTSRRRNVCVDDHFTNTSSLGDCDTSSFTLKTFSGFGCNDPDALQTTLIQPLQKCSPNVSPANLDMAFETMRCYSPPPGIPSSPSNPALIGGVVA